MDDVVIDDRPLYRDKRTERFAGGERVKEFQSFEKQAKKRLSILFDALDRTDLMRLPSNHFEAMGGDQKGHYSTRINGQWRLCFEWPDGAPGPYNIEILDDH
jgi:proteic killer suppression protein